MNGVGDDVHTRTDELAATYRADDDAVERPVAAAVANELLQM